MTFLAAIRPARDAGSAAPRVASPRTRRRLDLLAMAVPTLFLAVMGWHRRWMTDDGLIFTRVVRQIAAGNGPVYNVGERVETSTSTAWQWLLVAVHYPSPLSDAENAVYLGLALSVAGFWAAASATCRLHRRLAPTRLLLPAGALVFVVVEPVWDFLTAGMEIGLILFWIGMSWALLVSVWSAWPGSVPTRRLMAVSFWLGLGPLVRPDLGITAVAFLAVAAVLGRTSGWTRVGMAVVAGALPAAYEVFRMGYYGQLVPMPAVTKEAGDSQWRRGWDYVNDFNRPYQIWVPLLLLAVAAVLYARLGTPRRRTVLVLAAPPAAALAQGLYLVKVGGDFMHARMWVPVLLLLLIPMLLVPFHRPAVPLVAAVAVWAVVCGAVLRPSGVGTTKPPVAAANGQNQVWNERGVTNRATGEANPVSAEAHIAYNAEMHGLLIAARADGRHVLMLDPRYGKVFGLPPDFALPLRPDLENRVALVIGKLGAGGAMMPLDGLLADVWGLSSTIGGHLEQTNFTAAGHQKLLPPAWNIALYVDPAAFPSVPPALADPEQVQAAHRVLGCGDVRELLESVSEPMDFDRFWKNLTGAYQRTSIRIPVNAVEAVRKFCG